MYEKELSFMKTVIPQAYDAFASGAFSVSDKAAFDIVTDADQNMEAFLSDQIRAAFPGDRIHAEETAFDVPLTGRTWILDPIDGTWNFAAGSPHFGVQCALWDGDGIKAAAIYLPKLSEFYWAVEGEGCYCNGKRVWVKKRPVSHAIIAFGDLSHTSSDDALAQKKLMEDWFDKAARYRMFGASSVDYTSLVSSRVDAVILFTKNKWDLAAGWLLTREAGAVVLGDHGEDYSFSSRSIRVFSSRKLYLALTDGAMNPKGECV